MMQNLTKLLARIHASEAGAVAVFVGLVLPPLLGLIGLGVEAGIWFQNKRGLQTQTDAAAFAGAFAVASGHRDELDATALNEALRNGFNSSPPATIQLNSPPLTGPQAGNAQAVEAILTIQPTLLFASLFQDSLTIVARSVAIVEITGDACVLALHPTVTKAVKTQGTTNIDLADCIVVANSNDQMAIEVSGNGSIIADTFWTSGNFVNSGSASLILDREPVTNAWPLPDPYADLTIPVPPPGGCQSGNFVNTTATIGPGRYCNGIRIGGPSVITMLPGTYYIDRGDFDVGSQAIVQCSCAAPGSGVTIVLTSSTNADQIGSVKIPAGARVELKAASVASASNPYPGVVLFQDRRAPAFNNNKFTGGSGMKFGGAIYTASGAVEWSGNDGSDAPACTQIVALTITFIGTSGLNDSGCGAAGVRPINVLSARFSE